MVAVVWVVRSSQVLILVIKDGVSKLVNVKNQDGMTKLLDMVSGFCEKSLKKRKKNRRIHRNNKKIKNACIFVLYLIE